MNCKAFFFGILLISAAITGRSEDGVVAGASPEKSVRVEVKDRGSFTIKLYEDTAPKACARFLELVQQGFYDGQRFHKVVKSPRPFLVQAGDPESRSKEMDDASLGTYSSGTTVPHEDSGHSHEKGAVALATLPGKPDSGDSQFNILLMAKAPFLDGTQTVFGKVSSGMDVVESIELGDTITSIKVSG